MMKRLLIIALVMAFGLQAFAPADAGPRKRAARRVVRHRTVVVVHRGWPLRRPLRHVWVRPARVAVRVAPAVFLAPVVFAGVVVAAEAAPARDVLIWEDGETLEKDDEWTEFSLNCDSRGTKLWIEVAGGKIEADWAEVVFENGEARVVDFNGKSYGVGLYPLLDFADGRKVDHVRIVAKAKSDEARVVLKMAR
jgi:hypothetical protein